MPSPEGKKPGRRAHEVTAEDRATVRRMAGAKHADIARVLGLSVPTLRKHFAADLAAGRAGADLFAATDAAPALPRRTARPGVGGRAPFRPDPSQRRRVMDLAAAGKPPATIARVLAISEPTLRKHFAEELATGAEKVEAEIIAAVMSKARGGNVSAQKHALHIIGQARLDTLEDALTHADKPRESVRPDTPGKKLQARLDAAEIIDTAHWAEHLRPN